MKTVLRRYGWRRQLLKDKIGDRPRFPFLFAGKRGLSPIPVQSSNNDYTPEILVRER